MPNKIFISCGQRSEEKKVRDKIVAWFIKAGFKEKEVYVAIEKQTLRGVDNEIIQNLRDSDYYVFIDLRREKISCHPTRYRGSLFVHQELALAHLLEFERTFFLKQKNVELEGLARYLLTNAEEFDKPDEILDILEKKWRWESKENYSRNLVFKAINRDPTPIVFGQGRHQPWLEYIYRVYIENRRPEKAAVNTKAFFIGIKKPNGEFRRSDNQPYLKWAGQSTYERTILSKGASDFDALAINAENHREVRLHSLSDVEWERTIINIDDPLGTYDIHYAVFSDGFPLLKLELELEHTGDPCTTTLKLKQ